MLKKRHKTRNKVARTSTCLYKFTIALLCLGCGFLFIWILLAWRHKQADRNSSNSVFTLCAFGRLLWGQYVYSFGFCPKVSAILKKSVNWSDTNTLLPGESIGKAIVSLQIQEVFSDEAIQVLLWNMNEHSDCIVSTPGNFKVKRYKYFYAKNWIGKAIVMFQTPEILRWSNTSTFMQKKFESTKP